LVPDENDKKGVTIMVTSSLVFSCLLPPFIIDTGIFGADLMREWQHYTKSTLLFNKTHWMTQYAFVIYLNWLKKMFPSRRILLVVDRSTTHFGKLISEWLEKNHSSTSPGKIFLEYIQEGMTSIQQVCDISINKPLKEQIKKAYTTFRFDSLQGKCAKDLSGCVLTVPREDLVSMIKSAFDNINSENKRRRWIAHTFERCGQNPCADDDLVFEEHLASLTENSVYSHMINGNKQLNLA
jgi:hypothetical protein